MIDKTNAKLLSFRERITKDGQPFIEAFVRFDRSGKESRLKFFAAEYDTAKRALPEIEKNNNRCGVFYVGDLKARAGYYVLWSGMKKE